MGEGVEIYGSGGRANMGLRWRQGWDCGLGILIWVGFGLGGCLFGSVPVGVANIRPNHRTGFKFLYVITV